MGNLSEARKAANRKWDAENYIRISFGLPKELVKEFRDKCRVDGVSQTSIIKEAMENFLGKK